MVAHTLKCERFIRSEKKNHRLLVQTFKPTPGIQRKGFPAFMPNPAYAVSARPVRAHGETMRKYISYNESV